MRTKRGPSILGEAVGSRLAAAINFKSEAELYDEKEKVISRSPLLQAVRDADLAKVRLCLNQKRVRSLPSTTGSLVPENNNDSKEHNINNTAAADKEDEKVSRERDRDFARTVLMKTVGLFGETSLHLSVLYHTDQHEEMTRFLVAAGGGELVNAQMTSRINLGETALHTAIMKRDGDLVKFLLASGARLNTRATGTFFKRDGECYYGELPLSFAVSTGQEEIVNILLDAGADILAVDSFGNSAAHMAVLHQQGEMYVVLKDYEDMVLEGETEMKKLQETSTSSKPDASELPDTRRRQRIRDLRNSEGETPLTLAARVGSLETFSYLLGSEKQVLWTYNCSRSCAFPMQYFREAFTSVVELSRTDLICHPLLSKAAKQLWESGGRRYYFLYVLMVFTYLLTFSIGAQTCTYKYLEYMQEHTMSSDHPEASSTLGNSPAVIECSDEGFVALAICLPFAVANSLLSIASFTRKTVKYGKEAPKALKRFVQSPDIFLFLEWIHTFCFLYSFRAIIMEADEDILPMLSVSTLTAWFFLLYLASPATSLGPFIAIIVRILTQDMTRFVILYALSIAGFSVTMTVIFKANSSVEYFVDFPAAVHALVLSSIGYFDPHAYDSAQNPGVANTVFFLFVIVNNFCLMSLLVAMMFDTFAVLSVTRDNVFLLQRAAFTLELERRLRKNFSGSSSLSGTSSTTRRPSFLYAKFIVPITHSLTSLVKLTTRKVSSYYVFPNGPIPEGGIKSGFEAEVKPEELHDADSEPMWVIVETISEEERDAQLSQEKKKMQLKEKILAHLGRVGGAGASVNGIATGHHLSTRWRTALYKVRKQVRESLKQKKKAAAAAAANDDYGLVEVSTTRDR